MKQPTEIAVTVENLIDIKTPYLTRIRPRK